MSFTITCAVAENTSFNCQLANSVRMDIQECKSNEKSRALLTVLLLFDLLLDTDFSIDDYKLSQSILAVKDETVTVAVAGTSRGLIIFYTPSVQYAAYSTISQNTFIELYAVLSSYCDSTFINEENELENAINLLEAGLNQ